VNTLKDKDGDIYFTTPHEALDFSPVNGYQIYEGRYYPLKRNRQIKEFLVFLKDDETASHSVPAYTIYEARRLFKYLENFDRLPYGTTFKENHCCQLSLGRLREKRDSFVASLTDDQQEYFISNDIA
jgi:hypothetical protein